MIEIRCSKHKTVPFRLSFELIRNPNRNTHLVPRKRLWRPTDKLHKKHTCLYVMYTTTNITQKLQNILPYPVHFFLHFPWCNGTLTEWRTKQRNPSPNSQTNISHRLRSKSLTN